MPPLPLHPPKNGMNFSLRVKRIIHNGLLPPLIASYIIILVTILALFGIELLFMKLASFLMN